MKKAILIHLLLWILLSIVFFYSSESITKLLFKGFDDVSIWIGVLVTGSSLIFLILALSLLIFLLDERKIRPWSNTYIVSY